MVVTWLVPRETAAVSAHSVCAIQPHTTMHHATSLYSKPRSLRRAYACLALTRPLHFWQNDRNVLIFIFLFFIFLHTTAVTRRWDRYRNKSQHRKLTLEKKILPPLQQGFKPATFRAGVRRGCNHCTTPAPRKAHLTCCNSRRDSYIHIALAAQSLLSCC